MNLWIIIHHHGHGQDVYPITQSKEPSTEQQELACDDFDPDKNEHTEVRGPWRVEDLKGLRDFHSDMPIRDFVKQYVLPNLAEHKHCYAAIVPQTDDLDRDVYDIEIESTPDDIAAIWRMGTFNFTESQRKALEIGNEIERQGGKCFQNRKSWDLWQADQEPARSK